MRLIMLTLMTMGLMGCYGTSQPVTPAEQEEQEVRMRNILNDSSPRNRNQQPKAVPEFSKVFKRKPANNEDTN